MIAFCHLLNDSSGSPVILRQTIAAQSGRDRLVFVGSQGRGTLEDAGVPIRRYWYRRSRHKIVTLFTYLLSQIALYRALSAAKLPKETLIYVNTLLPFAASLWGRRHGRRVIVHAHEVSISPAPIRWLLSTVARRCADAILYVSDDHRSRLPLPGPPSHVVPNPIDPRIAAAGAATAYTPRRSGAFEVLMLASPRDFKGVPEYVSLARACPDMTFTLVFNADVQETDGYLPPRDRPGNLTVYPRTDRPETYYARADVLLNLSRPDMWIETFGLTLIEGMAFGLPVIAPPVGGPTEFIVHGVNGYLADSRDDVALETLLRSLQDDPQSALSLSDAARQTAARYTFERYAAELARHIGPLSVKVPS